MMRILLSLLATNPKWVSELIDIEGVLLQGTFLDGKELYAKVLDEFGKYYDAEKEVLKLNVPIYGTMQTEHCFYGACIQSER